MTAQSQEVKLASTHLLKSWRSVELPPLAAHGDPQVYSSSHDVRS